MFLKNLFPTSVNPKNEPAVAVGWVTGALTYVLGFLATHHWLTNSMTTDAKQYLPLAAGGIVAAAGHLIRPLVNSAVGKDIESFLAYVGEDPSAPGFIATVDPGATHGGPLNPSVQVSPLA